MIELIKLHAYVDGELSDSERREVESRLAGCSASRAEVNSIIGLKSTLKGHSEVDCSDVWKSCQTRLDAIDRVAKSGNFITKYSWGFVTAVALIMVIGGGYARHAQASSVDSSSLAGVFAGSRSQSPEKVLRDAQLDRLLRNADRNLNAIKLVGISNMSTNGMASRRYDLEDGKGRMSFLVLP
ncbi:MAG: zf-HC2 domain-containing protein, partial [Armatimonadota bacterium]